MLAATVPTIRSCEARRPAPAKQGAGWCFSCTAAQPCRQSYIEWIWQGNFATVPEMQAGSWKQVDIDKVAEHMTASSKTDRPNEFLHPSGSAEIALQHVNNKHQSDCTNSAYTPTRHRPVDDDSQEQ